MLSGAFQRTFGDFDPASGSFRMSREPGEEVGLAGDGLQALWTARALERAGFRVDAGRQTPPRVEIVRGGDGPAWHLHTAAGQRLCGSLYELVGLLRDPPAESAP